MGWRMYLICQGAERGVVGDGERALRWVGVLLKEDGRVQRSGAEEVG
jgi:hypothetical protein